MSNHQDPKKKKSLRSQTKYPNLDPKLNLRTRQELIYVDYLNKLNDSEKAWLNKFNGEFVNASFDPKPKKNLHKKKAGRKDCYDRNNSRNRCVLTQQKAQGHNDYLEEHQELMGHNPEDEINTKIDLQNDGWIDENGQIIKKPIS
jgi:hypothetical protein